MPYRTGDEPRSPGGTGRGMTAADLAGSLALTFCFSMIFRIVQSLPVQFCSSAQGGFFVFRPFFTVRRFLRRKACFSFCFFQGCRPSGTGSRRAFLALSPGRQPGAFAPRVKRSAKRPLRQCAACCLCFPHGKRTPVSPRAFSGVFREAVNRPPAGQCFPPAHRRRTAAAYRPCRNTSSCRS